MKEDKDGDVNKRLSKHSDPDHQEKKFCKSVIINDDCKFYSQTTKINKQQCVRFEEEHERCQSPYSISLSPNLVSKLYVVSQAKKQSIQEPDENIKEPKRRKKIYDFFDEGEQ